MRPGQRRPSLHCLALAYLFWSIPLTPILHARADATNVSSTEWEKILKNDQGKDTCALQEWLASDCPQSGMRGAIDRQVLYNRDDLNITATNCTCTPPYFNVLCGCRLTQDQPIDSVYDTLVSQCQAHNFSLAGNTDWMGDLSLHIPPWAYVGINNGTFNSVEILSLANPPARWSVVQIIVPIIVGLSVLIVAGIVFLSWRRYRLANTKSTPNLSFFAYVRKLFTPRAPSIRNRVRNDTWEIDERHEQVANDNEIDNDSSFMLQHPATYVQSPVTDHEVSHWSPATATNTSFHYPPQGRFSFTPRLGVEQRAFGASTMRNIKDRVRNWVPWVNRPIPVTNTRPTTDYRIDGDRTSIRSRMNTSSTLPKGVRGRYTTISEDDNEEVDAIGTGRTRINRKIGGASVVTDEDRVAVAESVLIIGEADFSLESGSSNHGQQTRSAPKAVPLRGGTTPVTVEFNVEPPSPTLESMRIASPSLSPGAPPLLPPPPQERPPLPPTTTRSTPRRTPSPHLRISTHFDETPINLSNSNLSNVNSHNHSNPNLQTNMTSVHQHTASRIPSSNPQQKPPSQHQRDPSGSSSSVSGTNELSYVTLPTASYATSRPTLQTDVSAADHNVSANNGLHSRHLPQQTGPIQTAPGLTHQGSDSSMDHYSILRAPNGGVTNRPRLSSSGDTSQSSQQSEFDPYKASGIPRPGYLQPNRHPDAQHLHLHFHHHQRSASDTSLPRVPGDSAGQPQRGWWADDDVDRASLLIDRQPMQLDDGMSERRGVYIATPRDVTTLGTKPQHYRAFSNETFATTTSDFGPEEWYDGDARNTEINAEATTGLSPISPTLRSLEADARNNTGFAKYVGRETITGGSGWDASTMSHSNNSPIEPPPPMAGRSPHISSRSLADFSPSLALNRTLSPNLSPRPGHARLGSESSSLKSSRSREDVLNPAKNDPVRLFPASVRGAGYTTGLAPGSGPTPTPTPPRTPQPSGGRNGNVSTNATRSGHTPSNSAGSQKAITGTFTGYVESDTTHTGGGTWGTDSSGVQSIFEPVQQLPDVYPQGRNITGEKRTP